VLVGQALGGVEKLQHCGAMTRFDTAHLGRGELLVRYFEISDGFDCFVCSVEPCFETCGQRADG
jgi:hypothetical protein